MSRAVCLALVLSAALIPAAHASPACQDYANLKDLPVSFKLVSKSTLGSSELHILSDGACTCNDLPAVQRRLGQSEPPGVNFACDAAEGADPKSK